MNDVSKMADAEGGGVGGAETSAVEPSVTTNLSADSNKTDAAEAPNVESGLRRTQSQASKQKIDLLLKATADAPIMKQKKWSVEADRKVSGIILFIKKYLKLEAHESLFLYVNQSFAPSPDQILRNLYDCFGTDGKLILHYCKTQAWG